MAESVLSPVPMLYPEIHEGVAYQGDGKENVCVASMVTAETTDGPASVHEYV
jgi:hypothetical protein